MTLKLNGTNSVAAPAYAGDDADTGLQCGTNELKLVTGGTARATVDSSGNFKAHGASILGSPQTFYVGDDGSTVGAFLNQTANLPIRILTNGTEEARFLAGGGLTFNGDTAAVNALDDYEEGTWTPTLNAGGSITTVSYATYTKVGRLVSIALYYTAATLGTGTENFYIQGLPFTSKTGYGFGNIGYAAATNVSELRPLFALNANYIYFHRTDANGAVVTHSAASTVLLLGGIYYADT